MLLKRSYNMYKGRKRQTKTAVISELYRSILLFTVLQMWQWTYN